MASACLYLFFAKPNLIVNTDLLIILCNYFSLICKAEILYPPQFYLKRSILIQDPWEIEAILVITMHIDRPYLPTVHWLQSYGEVFFHISWFVQWPHHWTIQWPQWPHHRKYCVTLIRGGEVISFLEVRGNYPYPSYQVWWDTAI